MENIPLGDIYDMVCEAPSGDGLGIEMMPEFLLTDMQANSHPHVHTFYEILWFFKGGGIHTVDFHDYAVEDNSIFFLSPGQIHSFDGFTLHTGISLKLCTDFLKYENADEDIFIKYNMFNAFDTAPYFVIKDTLVAENLRELIGRMRKEQANVDDFGHMDILRALIKIFLVNVQRHGARPDALPLNTTRASHRLFLLFRKMLEQEYDRMHTVKDYAGRLNVSSKTLTNSVTECSRKSPLAFINDRVILEAKRLLRFTNLMVKEIAYRMGYDDPSYFVKFFKRQTGYLPSDFREKVLVEENLRKEICMGGHGTEGS
ncbi:MAG: AraC family transcriptional regulator [Bacteroidales bacterium]|nr:AraC family transcriptional regulator [Bacteroidales bacterium]MCM1146966.1 AraC family transcriptional regulator [Bacteroidales bacterium]MCM1205901.1 AraC family transcriptional regulator [Bacillota bacterium]MCM1509858.1 AraC family transcriptional regulator [Clostridium sp.]